MDLRRLIPCGIAAFGLSLGGASIADDTAGEAASAKPVVEQLLDIMKSNGSINDSEYDQLLEQSRDEQRMAAAQMQGAEAEPEKSDEKKFKVKTGWDGLRVESEDGDFQFRVGGRIQADFAVYDPDQTPLGNGTELRRARIKTQGKLLRDYEYKLEVNFDPSGSVSVTDAWISYKGFKPGGVPINLTAGHLKVPFSQQSMTSSNWQVFQERALQDAFIDNSQTGRRRMGGIIESYGDHWFAALGFYGQGANTIGSSNETFGVATRVGAVPFSEEGKVLSISGGVYYRDLHSDSLLRLRARPESHVTNTRLVDTGTLSGLGNLLLYNASITGVLGAFHAQAEYTGAQVNRSAGMPSLYFGGFYVQAGYFLTGESRRYDGRSGKYRRIHPARNFDLRGGWGAWEVAGRFSQLSLDDEEIRGGREYDVTAAVNWYLNPSMMIRFNYVYARTNPAAATVGSFDENVSVFQGRAQVVF